MGCRRPTHRQHFLSRCPLRPGSGSRSPSRSPPLSCRCGGGGAWVCGSLEGRAASCVPAPTASASGARRGHGCWPQAATQQQAPDVLSPATLRLWQPAAPPPFPLADAHGPACAAARGQPPVVPLSRARARVACFALVRAGSVDCYPVRAAVGAPACVPAGAALEPLLASPPSGCGRWGPVERLQWRQRTRSCERALWAARCCCQR